MRIEKPLVIMFEGPDKEVITHIHPGSHDYRHYGLLVCDLVRHISHAFEVSEASVWEWVDKERFNPTTDITQRS